MISEIDSNIINKFKTKEWEKKEHAEFGTPQFLRNDMINIIPKYFWKNKNRKVLEPCCGKGGFLYDIVSKFMNSLRKEIPDRKRRYRHIVEEIIYFADINPGNVKICRKILDPDGIYELNYYSGDVIQENFPFRNDNFDLVIGNPPYNYPGKIETGHTLYQRFIEESLNVWLKEGGYLDFVTPPAWRKPVTERSKNYGMYDLMTRQNYMIFLEIHSAKNGIETFKAITRYDIYLIKKESPIKNGKFRKTIVIDQKGEKHNLNLSKFPWIPNFDYEFIQKLLAKPGEKTVNIIEDLNYHTDKPYMSKIKTDKYKYACIHGTPVKGLSVYYSSTQKHGHFKIPKVIIGDTGVASAFANKQGKFCTTQHAMAIVDTESKLDKILEVIKSEKMKEVLQACLWSSFQIDWRIFLYFRKDFWKYFLEKNSLQIIQ